MDFLESRYCVLNKILLSMIGLWPYQDPAIAFILRLVCHAVLVTGIFFKSASFVTKEYNLNIVLKELTLNVIGIVYIVKYAAFLLVIKDIKKLLEIIQFEWAREFKSEAERKILLHYAEHTRLLTIIFPMCIYPNYIAFVISEFLPEVLDVVVPLNQSRRRNLPIVMEYFIDEDKYCYLISLHVACLTFIGVTVIVSTETIFALFMQHVFTLFQISCFHIGNITNESVRRLPVVEQNIMIRRRIVDAERSYKRAIQFATDVNSSFAIIYCILIISGVVSASGSLFGLSQALQQKNKMDEVAMFATLVCGVFSYLFYCNYMGQKLMDHSIDIYTKLCDTEWYTIPLPAQKLLLLFLQRTIKGYSTVIGSLFESSFKGFASLANMAASYFMVMYTISQNG